MKKVYVFTTAAALLVAMSGSGFAAPRVSHTWAAVQTEQSLDVAGRARTYGEPTDAYASGASEGYANGNWARQYPQDYSYQNPYQRDDLGGTNGW